MNSHIHIVGAVIKKDFLSLFPIILLTALVQALDVLVPKLDIVPQVAPYVPFLWFFASTILILSVFQLDSPVSLVDDWLCRPVPKAALLAAKLTLLLAVLYLVRVLTLLVVDLALGYSIAESLQEAFLLNEQFTLITLATIMIAATVTPTVIQGIGALLALTVAFLFFPSFFIREGGPLEPGVSNAISTNGMLWMALAPAKLAALTMLGAGFLVAYRRHLQLGRIMLVASLAVPLLVGFSILMLPWPTLYGVQQALGPHDKARLEQLEKRISVHHASACFPAGKVSAMTSDSVYASTRQGLGVKPWAAEWLQQAGPNGVTFITPMQVLGVPHDWRAKLVYVQAKYIETVSGASLALRPSEVVTDNSFNHQWLLPQKELNLLEKGKPTLQLIYSLAVFKPLSYELTADGIRRKLPGLGYCGAVRNRIDNRIEVDCFSPTWRPAMLSAELLGISSSRVDSPTSDFAPAFVQAPRGNRIKLNVNLASLIETATVKVTAWQLVGFVDADTSSKGILGDEEDACPLPSTDTQQGLQQSSWKDGSPHTTSFIKVDDGVQLEVLDWGGSGTPLLLIPGLGATAHSFDNLAPQLAQHYRVFGLTRRGIGGSSHPDSGYDTATLARDAVRVLDAMKVGKVVIVGASIAGQELSWMGAEYPQRVAGLVYLDAAFDRTRETKMDLEDPETTLPPRPPVPREALRSYDAMLHWMDSTGSDHIPEGELLAMWNVGNRFMAGVPAVDMRLLNAIEANVKRPRYEALKVPMLAIYATANGPEYLMKPWYDRADPKMMQQVAEQSAAVGALKRAAIDQFGQLAPRAEIVEIPGATHGIYMSREAEVLEQIRRFIADKVR